MSATIASAIDTGYGRVKFFRPRLNDFDAFPAVASLAAPRVGGGVLETRDIKSIRVGGQVYEVGKEVAMLLDGARVLHDEYVESPEYLALTVGAMGYMEVDVIDVLTVGLPISLYAVKKEALEKRLTGAHELGDGKRVTVKRVIVIEQPVGGLIHYASQLGARFSRDHLSLIVDMGSRTVDWFVAKGIKPVPGRNGSAFVSVSAVIKRVAELVSAEHKTRYENFLEIERGLMNGGAFRLRGKPVDLRPYLEQALPEVNPSLTALKNSVGEANNIDHIVLIGGGPFLFEALVRREFPNHEVVTVADPMFSNVRGYLEIARRVCAKS